MSRLIIKNKTQMLDVTTLAHDITHYTSIYPEPGRLKFMLEKDPNGIMKLHPGQEVRFEHNGRYEFVGFIFTVDTNAQERLSVTAYDQSRYLSCKGQYVAKSKSLSQVFQDVCMECNIKFFTLAEGVVPPPTFLPDRIFLGETYWDILDWACNEASLAAANGVSPKLYFIHDVAGLLMLDEITALEARRSTALVDGVGGEDALEVPLPGLNRVIIGEGSLMTNYSFSISIDDGVCNSIMIILDGKPENDAEAERLVLTPVKDAVSIANYGLFHDIVQAGAGETKGVLVEKARKILEVESMPNKTLRIEALGIDNFDAGSSFVLNVKNIFESISDDMKLPMNPYSVFYVESAEHHYEGDFHTMSLDVAMARGMIKISGAKES